MTQFYTYLWLREDGTPYYVGKGHGKRAYTNHRATRQYRPKSEHRIIVQNCESEERSLEMEKWWIQFWGRKDLLIGILNNRTDGGDGIVGRRGFKLSEEHKRKIGESKIGKPRPASVSSALSKAHKGKVMSEESRKKMSESRIGTKRSEETKKKMSDKTWQYHHITIV